MYARPPSHAEALGPGSAGPSLALPYANPLDQVQKYSTPDKKSFTSFLFVSLLKEIYAINQLEINAASTSYIQVILSCYHYLDPTLHC